MMNNKLCFPLAEGPALPAYVQWMADNALLSQPECEWIIARGEGSGIEAASVGTPTNQRVDEAVRCVKYCAFDTEDSAWLYDRIAQKVILANRDYYQFDLTGLLEPVQFLKYTMPQTPDSQPGHYLWHQDSGAGAMGNRKLSLVIQLSPYFAYEGCRLSWFGEYGQTESPAIGQGEAVMFPSYVPHMVSPITRGVRYALVAWIHGPRFR